VRILAVEDDYMIQDFYRQFLTGIGHEVLLAKNGREAIALAGSAPDLIILDLGLPDVHGYEVVRALRSDPQTRDIPVVIVSGYPLAGAMDLAGVFGVSRKPYDVPLLERTLERVVHAVRQPPLHM
jgi:two-component system cell cycle response regulator DivK